MKVFLSEVISMVGHCCLLRDEEPIITWEIFKYKALAYFSLLSG